MRALHDGISDVRRYQMRHRQAEQCVKYHTLERLDSFVLAVVGKRLTFKELTA